MSGTLIIADSFQLILDPLDPIVNLQEDHRKYVSVQIQKPKTKNWKLQIQANL